MSQGLFLLFVFLFAFETNSNYQKFSQFFFSAPRNKPTHDRCLISHLQVTTCSPRLLQASYSQFHPTFFMCHNFHSHLHLDHLTLAMSQSHWEQWFIVSQIYQPISFLVFIFASYSQRYLQRLSNYFLPSRYLILRPLPD